MLQSILATKRADAILLANLDEATVKIYKNLCNTNAYLRQEVKALVEQSVALREAQLHVA